MGKIIIDNKILEYEITRSNRKTIALTITEEGSLHIKAPYRCSIGIIEGFLKEKQQWIKTKLQHIEKINENRFERNFIEGDKLDFLGNSYELKVIYDSNGAVRAGFNNEGFILKLPSTMKDREIKELKQKSLEALYRKLARKVFEERTAYYSKIIGVSVNRISIKEQKTVWGSCSSKNNINYNWKLVMAPLNILDYVVIHELCHIIERNHSINFWKVVAEFAPDYSLSMEWLKEHGKKLQVQFDFKLYNNE